jgi:hypothetical protein
MYYQYLLEPDARALLSLAVEANAQSFLERLIFDQILAKLGAPSKQQHVTHQ